MVSGESPLLYAQSASHESTGDQQSLQVGRSFYPGKYCHHSTAAGITSSRKGAKEQKGRPGDIWSIVLLARIFHELASRDGEDARATWQSRQLASEAHLIMPLHPIWSATPCRLTEGVRFQALTPGREIINDRQRTRGQIQEA